MEDSLQGVQIEVEEVSSEKTIFFPACFEKIDVEYTKLIESVKNSHEKVHLIIGVIKNSEKEAKMQDEDTAESISKIKGVDQVVILDSKPSRDYIDNLNPDFVAIVKPENCKDSSQTFELLTPENLHKLEESSAIKDFENSVEGFLQSRPGRLARISNKTHQLTASCKKKLKKIKSAVVRSSSSTCFHFENAISKSRAYLQQTFKSWGERRERILRSWMGKGKASAALLFRLLQEVWENA